MASPLKLVRQTTVSPAPSSSSTSLPLSSLDLLWLRFHPVERIFFYSLPQIDSTLFLQSIVPKLKHSLSLTLHHFIPLAGRILWPSHSPRPIIQYTPGDSVSLIIAESDSNFNLLSGNSPRDASLSRPLIPHLDSSDSSASVFSLQITLFPSSGFCIGISTHHAVFDGKSSVMFMKAWAYLCKTQQEQEKEKDSILLPKLKPFFERQAMIDSISKLESVYRDVWINTKLDPNPDKNIKIPRLRILDAFQPVLDESSVRATFELKREDLEKLRRSISNDQDNQDRRFSTFVVTTAYVSVCVAKAIGRLEKKRFIFSFSVDCRARLEASVPENYFGNCVMLHIGEEFSEGDGVGVVARKIKKKVREIVEEKGVLDGAERVLGNIASLRFKGFEIVGVAGATQFGVYETDFGWGRPEKVEISSVDRGLTFGLAESKDGNGGVEVGVVLNKKLMDSFAEFFSTELQGL